MRDWDFEKGFLKTFSREANEYRGNISFHVHPQIFSAGQSGVGLALRLAVMPLYGPKRRLPLLFSVILTTAGRKNLAFGF